MMWISKIDYVYIHKAGFVCVWIDKYFLKHEKDVFNTTNQYYKAF